MVLHLNEFLNTVLSTEKIHILVWHNRIKQRFVECNWNWNCQVLISHKNVIVVTCWPFFFPISIMKIGRIVCLHDAIVWVRLQGEEPTWMLWAGPNSRTFVWQEDWKWYLAIFLNNFHLANFFLLFCSS